MPGIASGDVIGFFDPHKVCFGNGESGTKYKNDPSLLQSEYRDQFKPFEGVFGFDFHACYQATLFRFPLRTRSSDLSKRKYTKKKVEKLFESLYEEAPIILLFMKNIQHISVYERSADDDECLLKFKVEIAPEMCDSVKENRQSLLSNAVAQKPIKSAYVADILLSSNSEKKYFRWLVVNQIGLEGHERIKELSEKLKLLPWVGCAIPLNADAENEVGGRIFCFLPLPRDVDCLTGLPMLVHGAFGVTDNRRGLLWPGSECQNNETAEWNVLLVEKILSSVIYTALESIITNTPLTGLDELRRREVVYWAVPKLSDVVGHWNETLLPSLFEKLKQLNLFHAQCRSNSSSWITLQQGLLDQMGKAGVSEETRNAVLKTLLGHSKTIITDLPGHVSEVVEKYFGERHDITPEFFRNFLRSNSIETTSRDDKLLLLDYILHDEPQPQDLINISLLPLASGQFVPFIQNSQDADPSSFIFVAKDTCTKDLLPNMEDRFLDKNIHSKTYQMLVDMATDVLDEDNPTQLITLTPELVIVCLRRFSLPAEWLDTRNQQDIVLWKSDSPNHPRKKWIKNIWRWINDTFDSLEQFQGIPLIPLETTKGKALGVLSKNSRFIFICDPSQNMKLPSQVVKLLKTAGNVVLPCTSTLLHVRHPDISSFIASPVPAEVILKLGKSSMKLSDDYIRCSSRDDRKILRSFFASPQTLSEEEKKVLRRLPLLDTLDGSYTAAIAGGRFLNVASPKFKLPSDFNFHQGSQVISSAEPESLKLVRLFDLELMEPADVFCQFLFPDIRDQSIYSKDETIRIMLWILERKYELQNQQFLDDIKDLPFVSAENGELKKPCELYDPNHLVLVDLFTGEKNKFPSQEFARFIASLKELGLRGKKKITADDLLSVAEMVSKLSNYEDAIKKVKALVKIFQQSPEFLQHDVDDGSLISALAELRWLPRGKKNLSGEGYPTSLRNEWYCSKRLFYKPSELFRQYHTLLVGTSAPILGISMDEEIQDLLGIQRNVNVNKVAGHLKKVINVWEEKARSLSQYIEMLKEIYIYLSKVSSQEIVSEAFKQIGLVNWVWHGSGFCSPAQMALEKDLPFEFRPPLFLLPSTLNDDETLTTFFKLHGVREQFSKDDVIMVLEAIKRKHDKSLRPISSKNVEKDLVFCRAVLEWLVKDGHLSEDLREKVFVPVLSVNNKLVLKGCEECTYCDQGWLRHGKSELDIPDDFHLIHESIPPKLAPLLGVPSLSSCLLSAESIEFEQTGPYEPITTRIKNILKEYKEGVGIFKELIQNADDAGASTVKFLVDWRKGATDRLFSSDMAVSQGPALWAYNNAVFTDKDFENINKLAGGTKVEDLSKIGRFGLGFNAVYHLTDVPSFISRNTMCVFDPNVNHISNHIHDKSRPGIRINLAKNPRPLTAFADQFSLYHQVFGCKTHLNYDEKFHYQGTLFRFPFRTKNEAKESEICETVYSRSKVKQIVHTLQQNASLLLVFTQNVKNVELYELGPNSDPRNATLVISIKKEIQNEETMAVPSYIKQCSEWWQKELPTHEAPSRSELVKVDEVENAATITDTRKTRTESCSWLVQYCVGEDRSINFAREEGKKDGLLPLAGAAVLLQSNSNEKQTYSTSFTAKNVKGEAFCFLPLSISTGLPIHVNSSFAVRSNRDGIWEKTTAEENLESRWNDCLLQDAIPAAYFKLLSKMVDLSKAGRLPKLDQTFHNFWPRLTQSGASWVTLISSFYTKLLNQRDLKLFCSNGKWMNITDGFILDDKLRKHEGNKVVKALQSLGKYVFDLPPDVINAMKESADRYSKEIFQRQTLTLVSFFERFLFPNLHSVPADLRNPIVHEGLRYFFLNSTDQKFEQIKYLYKKTACIPCSLDGQTLARPRDLITPKTKSIAVMYSPEENRFPTGELDDSQLYALEKLGMVKDLSWEEICGRAKSIEDLVMNDKQQEALQRSRYLIKYLRRNIDRFNVEQKGATDSYPGLQNVKFLPVRLTPPTFYSLPWKGKFPIAEFRSPSDLFLLKDVTLVGSSCLIVDDTEQSGCGRLDILEDLLGFSQRSPNCQKVLKQLEITRKSNADNEIKNKVCKRVYDHLNVKLIENPDYEIIEKVQSIAWLFLEGKFIEKKKIALKWKGYAVPFLYAVPNEYKRDFPKFLEITKIKKKFKPEDFLEALDLLRDEKQDSCLTQKDTKLAVTLINELKDTTDAAIEKRVGTIPLPDDNGVLCNSEDLTIPENFYVKYVGNERYVHSDVTPIIALQLGAKRLSTRVRKKYGNSMSMSFGQYEKLTDRIKSILRSYPCDVSILKELVQNADDAEATKVHFIYDKRTLKHERVLQYNPKEIQGPALCVYNNKYFSEDDFNGICKLGIGSKQDDPEKTGQYGIGFNAVYHLTDCPSFLSDDNTLCILDPHCEYSPEAVPDAPGGRYNNIDDRFREIFSNTCRGYLGDFADKFPLKGSTMFRLPLRTAEQSQTSKISISRRPVTDEDMTGLIEEFQQEAKKLLLFLNHVKTIGLWEINKKSELKLIYSVRSELKSHHEKKLHDLHRHLQLNKKVTTCDIPLKNTTYTIRIEDTEKLEEKWLIHQSLGIKEEATPQATNAKTIVDEEISVVKAEEDQQIPNVCDLGLFPRGGIAALLSTTDPDRQEEYVAYCFLPLPVNTVLPVHVNGHFALDRSRRDLWSDPNKYCRKSYWNNFMKAQILGPAYALLITRARKEIPHCEKDSNNMYFMSKEDVTKALNWYHKLFPDPSADNNWKSLSVAVYRRLKESEILPVVCKSPVSLAAQKVKPGDCASSGTTRELRFLRRREQTASTSGLYRNESRKYVPHERKFRDSARTSNFESKKESRYAVVAERRSETSTRFSIEWLPPNKVYFTKEKKRETQKLLLAALLQIRMPVLLYTPLKIHEALVISDVQSHLLTPGHVIQFLLTSQDPNSRCKIGNIPIQLSKSNIENESNLRSILLYCCEQLRKFPENLENLPLLLTEDNMLRAFTSENPVYCSPFHDLFPLKSSKFVNHEFVSLLSTFCGVEPDIVRHLTIKSLADVFMPDVFHKKLPLGELEHVSWKYPEKGVLSKKWFGRLWKFLKRFENSKNRKNLADEEDHIPEYDKSSVASDLVKYLGQYPVIPTKDGKLATVKNAKTVLAKIDGNEGDFLQKQVRVILDSLACPFLDQSITKHALTVVVQLVADPHRVSDVLHVLQYMNSIHTLDMHRFDERHINTLLRFFQADSENVNSMNIAKTLPFFKGVDGKYHSLLSYESFVQAPLDLPDGGIKELQNKYGKQILFLQPQSSTDLNRLYQAIGILVCSDISKFYNTYVLPKFSSLSRDRQIEFLTDIRDKLDSMTEEFKENLRRTECIPDKNGDLRFASSYFNPRNQLFKVMLKSDKDAFPTAPFNKRKWIDFLVKIGMNETCDQQQFIKFAECVENSARCISEYDKNITTKSKALVKYLLHSGRSWFHDTVCKIQFILPEEVEKELSSLHAQYSPNGKLEFVSYHHSVPWKDRHLVWTSAKLLPEWAYPDNDHLVSSLRIPSKPPLESVIKHVKIISKCVSEMAAVPDFTLPEKIIEVFEIIYVHLNERVQSCAKKPPSLNCNNECLDIGESLASVACILLNEERCLVKGETLSFKDTDEKLKPHFYVVPENYYRYEHLLKRLGVTKDINASQMANVLKSIKDSSTEDVMSSENEKKACFATLTLFESLFKDDAEVESGLSNCKELNLPSMKKQLVKSTELVRNVQPRLSDSVAKQGYKILYPLEKCGLKRKLEDDYFQALPKRLRPTPLSSLVREELDPSCKNNTCFSCTTMNCSFIQNFIFVLRSSQFQHGILRLLKHQKGVTTLDDEDKERAARFSDKVSVACSIFNPEVEFRPAYRAEISAPLHYKTLIEYNA